MLTIALIAFRESLEMFLILVPLIAFLKKTDKGSLAKYIYWGSLSGLTISAMLGALLYGQAQSLAGYANNLFEGSIMMIVSGLIVYNLLIIGSKKMKSVADKDENRNVNLNAYNIFVLAFLTVFRESLEIIMFGLPMYEAGAVIIAISLVLGVFVSSAITIIIYKTSVRLNIGVLFSIITLALIFVGSEMFGEGIATLLAVEDSSIITAGKLIYAIPCLYFFLKGVSKSYIKRNN